MTGLHRALYQFWSGFTDDGAPMNAWLSGRVPKETPYPYVTFEVVEGDFLGRTILTAVGWFRAESGYNVNDHASAFLDQVKSAIGAGKILKAGRGYVALYPNSSSYLSYLYDEDDHEVVGARVSYEVCYYL